MVKGRWLINSGPRWALGALVGLTWGASSPVASWGDDEPEGRLIQLEPDADAEIPLSDEQLPADESPELPEFWLGLRGGPVADPALRTHLQLAADTGVLIDDVVNDSPAAAAGLRKHDIVIRAAGAEVHDMTDLQKAVGESEGKPLSLRVIRLAKEIDVEVTPQPRPHDLQLPAADNALEGFGGDLGQAFGPGLLEGGQIEQLLRQLQQARPGMRMVGPGMFMGSVDLAQMPNGVSVQIQRQNNEPPQITVRRGEDSWTVKGDDPESLKAIPDDLRPFVSQLLRQNQFGNGGANGEPSHMGFGDLEKLIPGVLGGLEGNMGAKLREFGEQRGGFRRTDKAEQRLLERMERLERRLEELQRNDRAPADESNKLPAEVDEDRS